jgi:hypothetical protein
MSEKKAASKEEKPKKKKEKIIYVDDGRTLADMSNVSRTAVFLPQKFTDNMAEDAKSDNGRRAERRQARKEYRASVKEQLATFFNAMKMMFLPMLVVIGCMVGVYLILQLLYMLTKL